MAQLRQDYERFQSLNTVILAVGPEKPDRFAQYWAAHDLPFVGIPDDTHQILKQYGQEVNLFKLGRQPAQMIIDKEGVLRYVHYGHSMADIPSNEEILELLEGLADPT